MASTTSSRVWHITGANTGFGLELALKCLKEGDRVIAAVRSPTKVPSSLKHDNVKVLQFDLSYPQDQLNAYATEAFNAFGRVDVLVNNAAYAYMGAIEETEDEQVKTQFDINVFGVLRTIRAFLPHLRAQGTSSTSPLPSTIMNVSSVGGLRGFPSNGIYCSTKFAIEGITQALAAEIKPFNINCVIVEPGYFRTAFLASVAGTSSQANLAPKIAAYEGTPAHEARENFDKYNGRQPGNPVEGAARMWEYVAGKGKYFEGKEERLLRLPLGSDTGGVMRALAEDLKKTAEYYEDVWRSTDFQD
ncbi:putative oxidoreductase [Naviculisporaceae sp. PSN 640]